MSKVLTLKQRYIGDKQFYKMVLFIAVPIMIQMGLTNFVSLLDNILVGRLGTEQLSGVAIINQMMNVYFICIFGATSSAGIFGAQYFGKKDYEGVKYAFRFKLIACSLIMVLFLGIFLLFGGNLIQLFLHTGSETGDINATFQYAKSYLFFVLAGMLPYLITQTYSGTLRESGETMVPMKAGIVAVVTNLILDFILIYGLGPIPALGVKGAAIATVIARICEMTVILLWVRKHKTQLVFFQGIYKNFHLPLTIVKNICIKGLPLLVNEALWSLGMATLNQSYSTRGLAVVAGLNISFTITNVFNIVFIALGSAISIIVGQQLGAGKQEEAVDTDRKLIVFSVVACLILGSFLFFVAPILPMIYNTSDEVKHLATSFLRVSAFFMPMYAFMHATYFTLRSGGKTWITFLFDSAYIWVIDIPLAFLLTRHTGMYIISIYICCQAIELFKCVIGYVLVKKRIWVNDMTTGQKAIIQE